MQGDRGDTQQSHAQCDVPYRALYFGGMLYRVAQGDIMSVDSSSFLIFLIMNVLCLEFGIKKATVDNLFKRNNR